MGVWLLLGPGLGTVPGPINEWVHKVLPAFAWTLIHSMWNWQYAFLFVAVAYDLLPGRPRRHWSHWVTAVEPLLAYGFTFLPPVVWKYFHPKAALRAGYFEVF
jgi:hypothetical protein